MSLLIISFYFRWITKYIDEPKQSLLKTLLDQPANKKGLHVSYKIYDWMLNYYDNAISTNTPY